MNLITTEQIKEGMGRGTIDPSAIKSIYYIPSKWYLIVEFQESDGEKEHLFFSENGEHRSHFSSEEEAQHQLNKILN